MGCKPPHQLAPGRVDVDEAAVWTGGIVLGVLVLLRVGDEDLPLHGLDPERRVAVRELRIGEGALGMDAGKAAVPDIDAALVEVGRVDPRPALRLRDRQALEDRAFHLGHRLCLVGVRQHQVPGRDSPRLGVEDERRRGRVHPRPDHEARPAGDCDRERDLRHRRHPGPAGVERRVVGVVVGDPGRGRRAECEAPGVDEVGVVKLRLPGLVGDEVRLRVLAGARRAGTWRKRHRGRRHHSNGRREPR